LAYAQSGEDLNDKYIYKVYNKSNGLNADEIYDIVQDSTDFIWIGTNTGLFRFDGKYFKHFTTADGLPSNEVIKLFVDKNNKLWIATLKPKLCYHLNGKFVVIKDEQQLLKREIIMFGADDAGEMVFTDQYSLMRCTNDKLLTQLYEGKGEKIWIQRARFSNSFNINDFVDKSRYAYESLFQNKYPIIIDGGMYFFKEKKLVATNFRNTYTNKGSFVFYNEDTLFHDAYDISYSVLDLIIQDKQFQSPARKVIENSILKPFKKDTLFKGFSVNTIFIDKEKAYWAGGVNTGLMKLVDKKIKRNINTTKTTNIYAIGGTKGKLLFGTDNSKLLTLFTTNYAELSLASNKKDPNNLTQRVSNKVRKIVDNEVGDQLIITDMSINWLKKDKIALSNISFNGLKSICFYGDSVLLATKWGVFLLGNDLGTIDTLYEGRAVSVAANKEDILIGSVMGLSIYSTTQRKIIKNHLSGFQINEIAFWGEDTYVGTEQGLFRLDRQNKIKKIKNLNNLLIDKNINCIATSNNLLFVGTNEGFYRLTQKAQDSFNVVSYKIADGLPDSKINDIHIIDSLVYIGTPNGECSFNINDYTDNSICTLNLLGFSENGEILDATKPIFLGSSARNITIEFVAVAPKSNGEVTYYYQLSGFDDSLKTTSSGQLDYAKLPFGDYHLKVYAINKNGVQSATKNIYFTIAKPVWLRWWFLILTFLLLTGLGFFLYKRQIRKIQVRLTEKEKIKTLIAQSEQKALRAQMNPHFIYNCLNSIQQFFITNDLENGNRYITRFGLLIRQTLQNSEKQYINLQEECAYIKTYIELEQLRFSNSFSYEINIDQNLMHRNVLIPSMVIQPFVENAIEHGLHYKTSGHGKIEVKFELIEISQLVMCVITDNGIGLTKSKQLKAAKITTHQSKGIEITKNRLQVLNIGKEEKAILNMEELFDEAGASLGTQIRLQFPYLDK
jgi:hypothetical protein